MSRRNKTLPDDELLDIIDDSGEGAKPAAAGTPAPWRVLIVDDEKDVHSATLFALSDLVIAGRPLEFLHAYSAAEGRRIMETTPLIAVILLDVVMETGDAGLLLVRAIRDELGCTDTRIILRTGQPGYAPELEVIRDYDINDYKTKSELTRTRLVTSLTTAIRSYEQLRSIIEGRRKLDHLVRTSPALFARHNLDDFARGALLQVASLLEMEPHGVFCARRGLGIDNEERERYCVVSAQGRHAGEMGRAIEDISDSRLAGLLRGSCQERRNFYEPDAVVLHFGSAGDCLAVLFLETRHALNEMERQLLEVMSVSMSVGLENVMLFQRLNFSAYFDPLSRLPNRAQFVSLIDQRLRSNERSWTAMLLDVDHFSDINAALGHQTGDQLLIAVAKRLRAGLPAEVAVARVSGGAFGLLGPDAALDPEEVLLMFEQPIVVDGQSLMIQPFLGLERLSEAEGSGTDVFKNANIALGRAKNERRSRWQYFTREMQVATQQRLGLLHDLRHAADAKRGLSMHYQPQIDVASGRIVGAEALMRWKNDRGEDVPPYHFIPLAEYSQLIIELGEWALATACAQLAEWERAGHRDLRMSVNVSIAQFRDPNFVAMAQRCIQDSGADPKKIELEVTETMALTEIESVLEALYKLRDFGVSIAIDDFGSGFSSLNHLHRLPVNRLKIDRAFVADLYAGGSGANIAEMIVKLGRMFGMSVIAEGVETPEQLEALRRMGCQEVQGFLFSRPVPAAEFGALLRNPPALR
jgi:diguanylate cyclase (GGDEF)-like protein